MENQKLINELVKAADGYDREGRGDLADMIDEAIRIIAQSEVKEVEIEIPEDEHEMLQKIFESLGESLQ